MVKGKKKNNNKQKNHTRQSEDVPEQRESQLVEAKLQNDTEEQQEKAALTWAQVSSIPENRPYITKLYVSCVLMIVIPVVTFLALKYAIFPMFGLLDTQRRTLYAGICAIIVVKALSTAYLISAFKEGDEDRKLKKQQDQLLDEQAEALMRSSKLKLQ